MRVALVHDYLTQHGGAERVLEALHEIWPDAPVFTSLYDPEALPAEWRRWDIRESWLGRIPGARRRHRWMLPVYPLVFRSMRRRLRDFDVVVMDSSAWAHQASPFGPLTIVYCHSPARFLWNDENYLGPARIPRPLRPVFAALAAGLRWLDQRAAAAPDIVVANSEAVRERIDASWHRDARVIHPPVDTGRFRPSRFAEPDTSAPYLIASRLVPHKHIDLAVAACTTTGRPLIVTGSGPAEPALRAVAGPTVTFTGRTTDAELVRLMRSCRAFLLPGTEDFGISAVEAQAAGRPVIAFGAAGALETVVDGTTGLFFSPATPEALISAMERFESRRWDPAACAENARRFDVARFRASICALVDDAHWQRPVAPPKK